MQRRYRANRCVVVQSHFLPGAEFLADDVWRIDFRDSEYESLQAIHGDPDVIRLYIHSSKMPLEKHKQARVNPLGPRFNLRRTALDFPPHPLAGNTACRVAVTAQFQQPI